MRKIFRLIKFLIVLKKITKKPPYPVITYLDVDNRLIVEASYANKVVTKTIDRYIQRLGFKQIPIITNYKPTNFPGCKQWILKLN